MKIGIDIDDTISKTNEKLIERALEYDEKYVHGKGFKNKDAYSFMEMFYWSVLDVDGFMKTVRKSDFFLSLEAMDGAVEVLNKLHSDGHELILITRRNNSLATKLKTKKWLKQKGFIYDKIYFEAMQKADIGVKEQLDLFIDNDVKNIYEAMDKGIDSLLMSSKYTEKEKKAKKVNNWQEIYDYVNGVR